MVGSSLRCVACHSMRGRKQEYTLPADSLCYVY